MRSKKPKGDLLRALAPPQIPSSHSYPALVPGNPTRDPQEGRRPAGDCQAPTSLLSAPSLPWTSCASLWEDAESDTWGAHPSETQENLDQTSPRATATYYFSKLFGMHQHSERWEGQRLPVQVQDPRPDVTRLAWAPPD
jgi:hypothetical protein